MWYLNVYARPLVLLAYMIGIFSIPVVSIEILISGLTGLNWAEVWN
jgi:hypothetical protein